MIFSTFFHNIILLIRVCTNSTSFTISLIYVILGLPLSRFLYHTVYYFIILRSSCKCLKVWPIIRRCFLFIFSFFSWEENRDSLFFYNVCYFFIFQVMFHIGILVVLRSMHIRASINRFSLFYLRFSLKASFFFFW